MGRVWLVQPWFDEGDDWPEECGGFSPVRADDEESAQAEFTRVYGSFSCLSYLETKEVTEDEAAEFLREKCSGLYARTLTTEEQAFLDAREDPSGHSEGSGEG